MPRGAANPPATRSDHPPARHDVSAASKDGMENEQGTATTTTTLRALRHVKEAIDALPASFAREYRIAVAEAPHVVDREAAAIRFLRCCQGDPWCAAARLCQHLTYRRSVYGDDDWLKPLRLFDGALTPADVAVLRAGVLAILTPPPDWSDPRQVVVANFTRARGVPYYKHNNRIALYLCNTTVNEYSQVHGVHVLVVLDSGGLQMNPGNGRLFQVSHTSTIFSLHQVILANDPHETKHTLAHLCRLTVRRWAEKFWGKKSRLYNVAEATPEATLQQLVQLGLHPSTIPNQLGGSFSYERDFKEWLALRIVQEQNEQRQSTTTTTPSIRPTPATTICMAPSLTVRPVLVSQHHSQVPTATVAAATVTASHSTMDSKGESTYMPSRTGETATGDDSASSRPSHAPEDIRKRNCEYSKRHYYKKKYQVQNLQTECENLRQAQAALLAENALLQDLLRQAQDVVLATYAMWSE